MATRVPDSAQDMKPETVELLRDLVQGLKDSVQYHAEAVDKINDKRISEVFRNIAQERKDICEDICGFITMADEQPKGEGTFGGTIRRIWTAFRAGLNSGNPTVVLIEAERAEDVIVHKFKEILPQIDDNPVNDLLHKYLETIKSGHDRVLELRNAHQAM